MTTLEIVFIGLTAIVVNGEQDCTQATANPGTQFSEAFDVIMINPPEHDHESVLWIRMDALKNRPGDCWKDTGPGAKPANDCKRRLKKKWARYPLDGVGLRIDQSHGEPAHVVKGYRKVKSNNGCWEGTKPGSKSCVSGPCADDISWLPEYAKVSGQGKIDEDFLENPEKHPLVGSIILGLRGTLKSGKTGGTIWNWDWNDASCNTVVPKYSQEFARSAVIEKVRTSESAIELYSLNDDKLIKTIPLAEGKHHVRIHNEPPAKIELLERDDQCFSPHFDIVSQLLETRPDCRRRPWVLCKYGASDPFCPPVVVRGGD